MSQRSPIITLQGGARIVVQTVELFDAATVGEIGRLRAEAAKVLGGAGVGFGVFGAPSWEMAGQAVALDLPSSLLASGALST